MRTQGARVMSIRVILGEMRIAVLEEYRDIASVRPALARIPQAIVECKYYPDHAVR